MRIEGRTKFREGNIGRPVYIKSVFFLSLVPFKQSLQQYRSYSLLLALTLSHFSHCDRPSTGKEYSSSLSRSLLSLSIRPDSNLVF